MEVINQVMSAVDSATVAGESELSHVSTTEKNSGAVTTAPIGAHSTTEEPKAQTQNAVQPGELPAEIEISDRVQMAANFLNTLFGAVPTPEFYAYIWCKKENCASKTYSFVAADPAGLKAAAVAIEENDRGANVYVSVNLTSRPPKVNERANEKTNPPTLQLATIADIDIESTAHKSADKLLPTFDAARAILPFETSMLISSGYGLHAYCLYSEPIKITAANRDVATERNRKFIAAVKAHAQGYSGIDSVHDLTRILRMAGTFNLKGGGKKLCCVLEDTGRRFTAETLDAEISAAMPAVILPAVEDSRKTATAKPVEVADSAEYDRFRAGLMLELIEPAKLTRNEWGGLQAACRTCQ